MHDDDACLTLPAHIQNSEPDHLLQNEQHVVMVDRKGITLAQRTEE
jgi:hypothetical protein